MQFIQFSSVQFMNKLPNEVIRVQYKDFSDVTLLVPSECARSMFIVMHVEVSP